MMSDPRVSIVIPTYNRVGFVEQAIMSVLEQDYENLELLVLDDGSDDETPELLARIAERSDPSRFSWDRHENIGQSATLNSGWDRLDGDYIGYLSSDDLLLPGAITRLVAAAEEHPDAEIIYPSYRIDALGGKTRDIANNLEHDFVEALRWAVCVPGVGALIRRSFYDRVGGWDESLRMAPDVEWWLRSPEAKFLRLGEVLGVFSTHPAGTSSTRDKRAMLDERLFILDKFFSRDDLPPEVLAVKSEAYGAMLIESGVLFYSLEPPDNPRWHLEDLVGPRISALAEKVVAESRMAQGWTITSYKSHVEAAEDTIRSLRMTNDVLRDTAEWRDGRILDLEDQIARLQQPTRPAWKRAVRKLVPPPLRAPAIRTYRRLKGRS